MDVNAGGLGLGDGEMLSKKMKLAQSGEDEATDNDVEECDKEASVESMMKGGLIVCLPLMMASIPS